PRLNTTKLASSFALTRSVLSSALFSASGPWFSGSLISETRNMRERLGDDGRKGKRGAYKADDQDGGGDRRVGRGPDGGGSVERGRHGRHGVRPHALRRPQVPDGGPRRPQPHAFRTA